MFLKVLHVTILILIGFCSYEFGLSKGQTEMADEIAPVLYQCVNVLGGQFLKNGKKE